MKLRIFSFLSAFTFLFGDFAASHAQVVADGATNTLSNTTNSFASVTVGTNGSFTLLTLSNNALLTNSGNGTIGLNVTAKSNEVRLVSPSARWRMGNHLFVGSNGAFSRLVVSNGASVENFNGVLANVTSSSNSTVLITGAGSVWSNRGDLAVGFSGRENQLIVSNGGFVFNRFGYLGQQPGGSNNLARVTGSGSVWSNQFYLTVGGNDRSNRLIVEAGGLVTCSDGFVSGSSSSGNNEVLVTGPGSLWSNRFFLFMGDVAGRNRLVVTNGATVWSGGSILGNLPGASSNVAIVTGAGSLWTNDTTLTVGDSSAGNRLDVSNGGKLTSTDGALGLTLAAAGNNSVFLTGNGSAWNNRGNLIVGNQGSGNTLTASNGASITASNLFLGFTVNSLGNQVTVDGGALRVTNAAGAGVLDVRRGAVSLRAGSVDVDRLVMTNVAGGFGLAGGTLITRGAAVTNIGGFTVSGSTTNPAIWDVRAGTGHALAVSLSVGSSFSFNQMLITNGGTLTSGDAFIGSNAGSRSNVVLLAGAGSKWTAANLDVGNGGAFNWLIVSNGATLEDVEGALAKNSGSSNNLAVVTGAGSLWTNRDELYVGYQGSGNQLVISNGGTVSAFATRFLGHASGAVSNNAAIVTGAGSRWVGPGNLEIGGPAAFCRVLVTDGGLVQNNFGFIGNGTDSSNNLAVIAGAGSTWSNAMVIHIGDNGDGNQLVVSNGGFVSAASGEIGSEPGSVDNQVTVTGAGSKWSNTNLLYVGNYGVGNRLVVAAGGAVYNADCYIGGNPTSSNNLALVTGAGSVWSNAGSLLVGGSGAGNQLIVSNGAAVFGDEGVIGYTLTGSNNLAVVTGAGSVWSNSVDVFVGNDGRSNTLIVSAGGTVRGQGGILGLNPSSSNNVAVVADAGSVWSSADDFYVGQSGAGNQLLVSNGGLLTTSGFVSIGDNASSISNRATLTGAGSRWLLGDGALVGYSGSGNRLVVSNGAALVTASISYFGFNVSSSNNEAVVTGPGTIWTNSFNFGLRVGNNGANNRLLVGDGGLLASFDDIIGENSSSSNNVALVTGVGSLWTNRLDLTVGQSGSANLLVVSNGATLAAARHAFIGRNLSAGANVVTVTDSGTRWFVASNLVVGSNGPFNRLVIRNGARLENTFGAIGEGLSSSNNVVIVTGSGSVWSNANQLNLGGRGGNNQLVVSNGALVHSVGAFLGGNTASGGTNEAVITGPGSFWRSTGSLFVGTSTSGNRLVVTNGGWIRNSTASIGSLGEDNEVTVTGAGSTWTNGGTLIVGVSGRRSRLVVSDGAVVHEPFDLRMGENATSTNNRIVVDGGTLVMASSTSGLFDVRRGTNVLNAGLIYVGQVLLVTNPLGVFEFNGGTLQTGGTIHSNGQVFTVGNGANTATLRLRGGTHGFANNLVIVSNATLTGDGTVTGGLTTQPGGRLSPGFPVGNLVLSNSPSLQGTTIMEIGNNGATYHDRIQVAGPLTYGGSLVVTNIDFQALAAGDRFTLFNATSYSGAFASIILPPLPPTLRWTNMLAVDGSLEVVPYVPPPVGLAIQLLNGLLQVSWPTNGADYCLETSYDLAPPITWQTVSSGITTNGASFVFTLASVSSKSPQQFFRLAFPCSSTPLVLSLQLSNHLVTVSWPSNEFRLETTFDLSAPATWQTVSNGINNLGGLRSFSFTNSPGTTKQFFRLAFP
jgi:fibronectin-binding autotransporter adhesin